MTNSTIAGNQAAAIGGGGISNSTTGTVTVTNSTIAGNSATSGSGGGIRNYGGTLNLTNTLIATNSAPTSGPDINGTITASSHNLIGDVSGSTGITNGVNGDIVNPTPLLGTLTENGGPTRTVPLLTGSPAIAHVDPAVCSQSGTDKVNGVDQRGVTRPTSLCAIGAFEPLLSAIGPVAGGAGGGNRVTLIGAGFVAGATTVSIGGSCTVQFVNSTMLRCTTAAHTAGVVDVEVTVGSETGTLAGAYTYGVVAPLPPNPPPPGIGELGVPNPLPSSQPPGASGGPAPNPLPAARP